MTTDGKEPYASLLAKIRAVEALIEQAEDRVREYVPPRPAAALIAEGTTPKVSTGALRYALSRASDTAGCTVEEDW